METVNTILKWTDPQISGRDPHAVKQHKTVREREREREERKREMEGGNKVCENSKERERERAHHKQHVQIQKVVCTHPV